MQSSYHAPGPASLIFINGHKILRCHAPSEIIVPYSGYKDYAALQLIDGASQRNFSHYASGLRISLSGNVKNLQSESFLQNAAKMRDQGTKFN